MTDLRELLESLGIASSARPVMTPEEWLAAADARPAWRLWGKARPAGVCPAHPLLCHAVDVAAVAGLLLTSVAPEALRARLLRSTELAAPESLRFLRAAPP